MIDVQFYSFLRLPEQACRCRPLLILTPLFVVSATLWLSPLNLKYPNHAVTTNFNAFLTNVAIKLTQRNTCATANKTSNKQRQNGKGKNARHDNHIHLLVATGLF